MDSFTVTFTGSEPELKSVFFPPIELDGNYVIGLVDFQSYNSIFNVKKPLNTLTYYKVNKITTPKGTITIEALNKALDNKVVVKVTDKETLTKINAKVIPYKGLMLKLNKHKGSIITLEEGDDVYYYDMKEPITIEIPEGTYEILDLTREVQKQIPDFTLVADNNTMKATLVSGNVFDFTKPSLGSVLLGFKGLSTPFIAFHSTNKININNINVIRVKCNIANGSYLNGNKSHTIHSFYPEAPPGYKIIEVPRNIIYFPVNKRTLDVVSITFADQNDRPIDFNGEETTITCHIKKI
jgi:hypothetical protein